MSATLTRRDARPAPSTQHTANASNARTTRTVAGTLATHDAPHARILDVLRAKLTTQHSKRATWR